MNIGIDARFYSGEFAKGLGRYTEELIDHLLTTDTQNHYVLFLQGSGMSAWKEKFAQDPALAQRVRIVEAPYRWYTLAEQIGMPRLIRRAGVDMMHFPHFNVPLLYRKPFIVTIHDLIILQFPTKRASTLAPIVYWIKQFAAKRVLSHAAKNAQHVITVSEFSKKDICTYFHLPEDRVTVTYESAHEYSFVAPDDAQTPDGQAAVDQRVVHRYGITGPYILYVGNAYPHKNIEQLIAVAALAKKQMPLDGSGDFPWKFVFVGKKDYFYERIIDLAQQHGVADRVQCIGYVPDRDLGSLYRRATAYIFPSLYEGFGLPPLEAMQYGTPVICSTSSCLPEVVGDAAYPIDPHSSSAILTAIEDVLHSEDTRQDLINKGYERLKLFSWEKMAEQTLAVYKQYGKNTKTKTR